ncbi:MAG: type VII secretion protein EssC [Lachnospiraceae bacterium]|nr:type VII secretion protein EssC [Lachnospiraceae bacterium]
MGYIVMAYAEGGYQEFLLPELDNSDYEILLERQIFGMAQNLQIAMEIVDGSWSFVQRPEYSLFTEGQPGCGVPLSDGMVLGLKIHSGGHLTLVVMRMAHAFPVFRKYDLGRTNQLVVGKSEDCAIAYDFMNYISRNHAVLFRYGQRWVVQDTSSNGSYLNGRRIQGQAYLNFGDQIILFGLRIIFLGSCLAVCALSGECRIEESCLPRLRPRDNLVLPERPQEDEEKQYFKRSPRTVEPLYTEPIEIEAPPPHSGVKKRPMLLTIGPSLTMAIPMVLGCVIAILGSGSGRGVYMFTGVITAVSAAILGVIWAFANLRYAAKEEEENEELRYSAYGQYLIDITEFIKEKYDENRAILYRTFLSGSECCCFGEQDVRLWNHNARQEDFMTVRLGTGQIPFQSEIVIPKERFTLIRDDLTDKPTLIRESYQTLQDVPVCMDIQKKGIIGLIGGEGKQGAYGMVRSIAAQLAANNCYTEVKMVFIYEQTPETADIWSFARWLPHVWSEDHRTRLIAGDKSELGDISYELSKVFRMRTEEQTNAKEYPLPHYVIFVDSMEMLEGELLESFIYNPRPEYGITTILLAERYGDLPNSCEEIIENDGTSAGYFHVYDSEEKNLGISFDVVRKEELEGLARRLCGIEVNESTQNGEIPESLSFFEMYGVSALAELRVLDRWKKNRNYDTMRVPIGEKAGGSLCYLDVHEKYHGPHGLVAGTTGSGKSETLQTWILSLAVNFSPDDIAFFIIDFKGGGMANLFSDLPHMAGQISNLSGNQVQRAMISIKSENQRRQRIFAQNDVNNINHYTRLYKEHRAALPIPHLFIIIDEFAELKREEPEFMKELISVAQVGRSLGVHLILATQKPSGTVDDNIWSNSKFRLCLRVQDRQDSNDMLRKPDAAYITQAGRGYLQVGSDEIYEQFQSGYSGAEYVDDPAQNRPSAAVMLTRTGRISLEGNASGPRRRADGTAVTQLDAVIAYLSRIAKDHHYDREMLLWLPVLPRELYLDELEGYEEQKEKIPGAPWSLDAMIGLYDDPANQAQKPLHVSFSEGGHLAVCGAVTSGKSTFVQTLLYSLLERYTPTELNFYVLDYSSRMLLPFAEAPHCGGVILDTDEEKVKRFFHMLSQMMEERKNQFGGGNYSQYVRACGGEVKLPAVLIVIDNYAGFREKTGSQFDDFMVRLSREGAGYGLFLVLTAGGFGASEIPARLGGNMRTVISLEMGDKFKYAEVMRVSRIGIVPETDVKGRGLANVSGNILEFQTALAKKAPDAYELSESIRAVCKEAAESWTGKRAARIPVIPEKPTLADLQEAEGYEAAQESRRYLPLGYLEQDASLHSVDLWRTYCYLIQGKSRTGKKNVLKLLMYAAVRKAGARVCLIELNGKDLQSTAELLAVEYLSEETAVYEFFKSTVPVFKERNQRKRQLLAEGLEGDALAEKMNEGQQIFIFIADMVSFLQMAYRPSEGVGDIHAYLENITEKGSSHGFYFFGCMLPEQHAQISARPVYANMISYQTGVHLGGNTGSQRLFQFTNIPHMEQLKAAKPGTGLIPDAEDASVSCKLVLPLYRGSK